MFVGLTLLALTWNPVPGVKNRAPRGELLLKKFAGIRFGAEKASGTPSQLISRRPVGNVPPIPLLSPKKFLKAVTVFRISFGVTPDASNVIGHNIGFWFGYLAGCLTPVFTDSAGFYSRYPSDQSASCGNFPQFLLCGCCFSNPCLCKNAALGRRPTARRLVGNRIQFSIQITIH